MALMFGSLTLGGGFIICGLFSIKMLWHGVIGAGVLALVATNPYSNSLSPSSPHFSSPASSPHAARNGDGGCWRKIKTSGPRDSSRAPRKGTAIFNRDLASESSRTPHQVFLRVCLNNTANLTIRVFQPQSISVFSESFDSISLRPSYLATLAVKFAIAHSALWFNSPIFFKTAPKLTSSDQIPFPQEVVKIAVPFLLQF